MAKKKVTDASVLGLIYTLILAAIIAVFIGITINTFHPAPDFRNEPQVAFDNEKAPTAAEELEIQRIDREHREKVAEWSESTSVVVVITATILVALGLFLAGKMPIMPNGILLGGFFTLFYGTILGFQSNNRYLMFGVTTVSMIVILVAGYLKFVHGHKE